MLTAIVARQRVECKPAEGIGRHPDLLHFSTESATLHFMTLSASVQERREATAARLLQTCRRLTLERGFSGFTIDEACVETGISRRSFFNYYPSKEEAVLGIVEEDELIRFAERFLDRGSRGWGAVVDDLIELTSAFASTAGLSAEGHADLMAILAREPRLLARVIGQSHEREGALLALIVQREDVSDADPFARACVDIISATLRSAGARLHEPEVADDFGAVLRSSLSAMRAVLAPAAGAR